MGETQILVDLSFFCLFLEEIFDEGRDGMGECL